MDDTNKIQFAPFVAINQFMLPEYRQEVIEVVYKNLPALSTSRRSSINQLIQRYVKIAGFRKSDLAPFSIKVRQSHAAFEKHSDFVAQLLAAWCETKPELAKKVYDLLIQRGWELLPVDADRARLPGFLVRWPEEETYDVLDAAFHNAYPEEKTHENDIRLMVVWLGGRLPFDMVESEESE